MNVEILPDTARFAHLAGEWLASDPFGTNVLGTQLAGVVDGTRQHGVDAVWVVVTEAGSVTDTGRVVGAAMHTPPYPPLLPRLAPEVAEEIAAAFRNAGRPVVGVNGEQRAVRAFADAWTALTGVPSELAVAERMYRLGTLLPPVGVPGSARLAGSGDIPVVADWLARFTAEALAGGPSADPLETAARKIGAGLLWLWEVDREPVSMAGGTPVAAGVARVGPVFTPPLQRRHGYGAAVTARVTQAVLDSGAAHVVLYTDLANPTSNAIYQRLGFRPDHAAEQRIFGWPTGAVETVRGALWQGGAESADRSEP